MKRRWHVSPAEADAAPIPEGRRSAELLRHGSLELRWYAPTGNDPQMPHERDEIYIVARGRGHFVRGEERVAFGPGDALFVPAKTAHHFEDFSDDLAVWVALYGAEGGEQDFPFA